MGKQHMATIRLRDMDFLYCALLFLTLCFPDVFSQCDNELSVPLGLETYRMKFPSENEPTYGVFLLCEWRFVADSPDKRILYQLSNIGVDCGDTLLLYTDTKDYDKGICCANCNKAAMATPGAELKMYMNSDGTTKPSETGFTMNAVAAKGFETCPTQPIQVTSEKQQITSPQFPGQYLANLNCKIELTAPTGVTLRFQYIDVETHTDCPKSCCDVIHIYEGTIKPGNEPISSICGKNNFEPNFMFESTGTTLTLQLVTDDQVPRRGFVAIVQAKNSSLVTTTPEVIVPQTTEPSHDVFETLMYSRFELRCEIPTLENGVDITWTKDGFPFQPLLDSNRVYFMEDKSLVIFTSILKEDDGLYICEADNPFNPTYTGRVIVKERVLNCDQNTCLHGGTCLETITSYDCICTPGYEGQRCEKDVDECQELNICNNGSCINTVGSYTCDCKALSGWTGDFCDVDVNECEVNTSICAPNGVCMNTIGGFDCQCKNGWMGSTCHTDIDECKNVTSVCSGNGRCLNRPGSFSCECNTGWEGPRCTTKVKPNCIQIPCKHNGSCLMDDTTKNYSCVCPEGFEGEFCEKDIDECKTIKLVCSGNGRCVNGLGKFSCECNAGWEGPRCSVKVEPSCIQIPCKHNGSCLMDDTTKKYSCVCSEGFEGEFCQKDIDECKIITSVCSGNGRCVNGLGKFSCECNAGWEGPRCSVKVEPSCIQIPCKHNGSCVMDDTTKKYSCVCAEGFEGEFCQKDIDECKITPSVCSGNGRCVNGLGKFSCECNAGWEGPRCSVKVEPSCIQIPCKHNGSCVMDDTTKKYSCVCDEGYEGEFCQKDIDECKTVKSVCSGNGRCLNRLGSFSCVCNTGWRGQRCSEKVEPTCIQIPCKHNGSCVMDDTTKKYSCVCTEGFQGDYCQEDINECVAMPSACSGNGRCINRQGGFYCVCDSGWEGARCSIKVKPSCIQIPCKVGGTCILNDTTNSYQCACADGYEGEFCERDINECVTLWRPCSGRGKCVNSYGSYFCECFSDWEGKKCEKRVDPCLSNPCPKNSVCNMKGYSYECTCLIGWEGPNCDQEVKKATGPCAVKCKGEESCYMEHNCTHYEHCYAWNAAQCHCTLMICSFGTFWNSKINNCDRVPKVLCKSDPCLTLNFRETYSSNFNCRTFYMCNKNKQSLAMCCAKGYSYNHTHQGCKPNPYCNLECSEQPKTMTTLAPTSTSVPLGVCYFRAINGRPDKYYNIISRIQQDCPQGTVFKSAYCVCVEDITFTSRLCNPLVYVDFAGNGIINLFHQNYIEVKNVFQVQSRKVTVFYGLFNETTSSIQVPRLSTVALSRLMIQLRFFSSKSIGPRYQILVSNCYSSAKPWDIPQISRGQTPSLAIVADTVDKHLTFLGYSDDWRSRPVIFALPYKDNAWNNVELTFNGNSLRGRIRSHNPDNTTFESKDEKPLSGRIAASFVPLSLGRCTDKDAFSGYMDMVKIYDCIPAP